MSFRNSSNNHRSEEIIQYSQLQYEEAKDNLKAVQEDIHSCIIELGEKGIIIENKQDLNIENFLKPDQYEIAILVTAYNEKLDDFNQTFDAIKDSIFSLYKDVKIALIFIVDGLKPFCESNKIFEQELNQDSIRVDNYANARWRYLFDTERLKEMIKNYHESKNEKSYFFCRNFRSIPQSNDYFSIFFCIKDKNKKKLNTHKWFLKGFCAVLKPKFIFFLDVGTKPQEKSIHALYNCLENNPHIAGCCGEIIPENSKICNFIHQAQVIEYKFSHLFDKAFENMFGYISVLPGAYSAYRFECFTEDLLDVYFKTEGTQDINLFDRNMYLAEDRILCLELFCQKARENLLVYVPEAQATTDIQNSLTDMMKQRRRWINGSWFSIIYTIKNWKKINESSHGWLRKFGFFVLTLNYILNAFFSWVLVGLLYLTFAIAFKRNLEESNNDLNKLNKFSTPILMFYVSTLIAIFISSISVEPKEIKLFLNFLAGVYGIFTFATFGLIINFMLNRSSMENFGDLKNNISIVMFAIMILMTLAVTLKYFKTAFVPMLKGIFQYFCLSGAYINIFLIYSICNIHDVSWGNRPDRDESDEIMKASFEGQRIFWVSFWIMSNLVFSLFFNWSNGKDDENASDFINYLAWVIFLMIFSKVLGGFLFAFFTCSKTKGQEIHKKSTGEYNGQYLPTDDINQV